MMRENIFRRTWDIPRQQQTAAAAPKRSWLKAFRPYVPANARGTVAAQAPASSILMRYPMILIGLAIAALFILGAVIAIALIPLYLGNKSVTVSNLKSNTKNVTFDLPVDQNLPVGPLSDEAVTKLLDSIKATLPASLLQSGNFRIIGAEIVLVPDTGSRQIRQDGWKKVLRFIIEIIATVQSVVENLQTAVTSSVTTNAAVIQTAAQQAIVEFPATSGSTSSSSTSASTASTSTIPSNVISTVATGRRRRNDNKKDVTTRPMVTYQD